MCSLHLQSSMRNPRTLQTALIVKLEALAVPASCIRMRLTKANVRLQAAKQLADAVIPNEYGIEPAGKMRIGSNICTNLLGKVLADLGNMRDESIATAVSLPPLVTEPPEHGVWCCIMHVMAGTAGHFDDTHDALIRSAQACSDQSATQLSILCGRDWRGPLHHAPHSTATMTLTTRLEAM